MNTFNWWMKSIEVTKVKCSNILLLLQVVSQCFVCYLQIDSVKIKEIIALSKGSKHSRSILSNICAIQSAMLLNCKPTFFWLQIYFTTYQWSARELLPGKWQTFIFPRTKAACLFFLELQGRDAHGILEFRFL